MASALKKWTEDDGIVVENGAVFWMNPNGAQDAVGSSDPIVVAQLTLASGTSHMAQIQMQGRSDIGGDDWNAGVSFLIGPQPPQEVLDRGAKKIADSFGKFQGRKATIWDACSETVETGDSDALDTALRGVREEYKISDGDILDLDSDSLMENDDDDDSREFKRPDGPVATQTVCWRGRMPHMLLNDCELVDTFVLHVRQSVMGDILAAGAVGGENVSKDGNEISSFRTVSMDELAIEVKADPMSFTPWFLAAWFDCPACWPEGTDRGNWPLPSGHGETRR